MTEQFRFPGPGGPASAVLAKPGAPGPLVVVLGLDPAAAEPVVTGLADVGAVGVAPDLGGPADAEDQDQLEVIASLVGALVASRSVEGETCSVLATGAGIAQAVAVGQELDDVVARIVAVGPVPPTVDAPPVQGPPGVDLELATIDLAAAPGDTGQWGRVLRALKLLMR